jgi:hypothetical protein
VDDDDLPGRGTRPRLAGTAADLDCLLWNPPPLGTVTRDGDATTLAGSEAVLAEGIQ